MHTWKHALSLAAFLFCASASEASPQGEPCPPPAACGPCPSQTETHVVTLPASSIQPGVPISIPSFDPCRGSLAKVHIRTEIVPEEMTFRLQNLNAFTCQGPGIGEIYNVAGSIDVFDPFGGVLARTSDKVQCLGWFVTGNVPVLGAMADPAGCIDFGDPDVTFGGNCPPVHGGPCQTIPHTDGTCAPCGTTGPSGLRRQCGSQVNGSPLAPGYSDSRKFPAGSEDVYACETCFLGSTELAAFLATSVGGQPDCSVELPFNLSLSRQFPSSFPNCGNVLQQAIVKLGLRVTVQYVYCPYPPTAENDATDVCRSVGSTAVVNVLANDTVGIGTSVCEPGQACSGLDCAYLTGTNGILQGQYGTAQWVTDPACTNTLCNLRCIRYALTAIPPPGVRLDQFTYTVRTPSGCLDTATVSVRISSPEAVADSVDVCRELNSASLVNVLSNDASGNRPLDCAYLTGTNGITQGLYGTAQWVTDASATNPLCNQRGIRYRLTTLPPGGIRLDTFTYTIRDSFGCTSSATVQVRVSSPTAVADSVDVCRELSSASVVNVLANDTSGNRPLDCAYLTGTNGITQGLYGTAQWVTDASATNPHCNQRGIRYQLTTLPPGGIRLDTFTYTIRDSFGCTSSATVQVRVSSPTAVADSVDVCRELSSASVVNVLANDTSGNRPLDCAYLTGTNGITQGLYGTAQWVTDASATNPHCNQRGIRYQLTALPPGGIRLDTFTYTIRDSFGCTSSATVQVRVSSPTAVADSVDVCRELNSASVVNVLVNDTSGNRPLDCAYLTGTNGITQGLYGTAQWVTDASATNPLCNQRGIRYRLTTLPPGGIRLDTFTYTIRDSFGCTSSATVQVRVSSPTCQPDTATVCGTAASTTLVNVLANDASGNRPLDCAYLSGTTGLTQGTYGTVQWVSASGQANPLCDQRSIRYTLTSPPPAGIFQDTFSYTIRDSFGCTATCPVSVTICVIEVVPVTTDACPGETVPICVLDGAMSNCGTLGCDSLEILGSGPSLGSAVPCGNVAACTYTGNCSGAKTCTGGCILYVAGGSSCGTDTFLVRVRVGECFVDVPVSVRVKPRPDAVDDLITVQVVSPGQVFDIPVLANDLPCIACDDPCSSTCVIVGGPTIVSQPDPAVGTVKVLPDGTVRFTAGPGFTTSARFCYRICNSCGCADEACVEISNCIAIDRRKPGSLLLWPEYDNRDPLRTLITVTNTFCVPLGPPVYVEFVYIDKETCLETNFTMPLTPCDTLTLYSSAQAPISSRGFLYAFAKDASGAAIAYNHLIGNATQLDPVSGDSYGFNAVSLRSPLVEGSPTDLDGDGIRDLDLHEYDPLPDEVLVPRFLGQDPTGPGAQFHSDLVLLGLSGGASFDTTIQLLVYNDSEDVVSQNVTIHCWEKRGLLEWSGAFLNSFLMSLGDDPDEILGQPSRTAGWIRLKGLLASSGIEEIQDPAIYALFIERAGAFVVADLPWEICSQNNGDLWPTGPLGDGPVPVAGDNQ